MKAWKRLRLLLSGASRLTWLYRDPIECVQEPEDGGMGQPGPGPAPVGSHSLWLTWFHRCLHHTPRAAPTLSSDEVLPEWLQPISHQSMEGRAEGGQYQMPHIWAQSAIPQLSLETARKAQSAKPEGPEEWLAKCSGVLPIPPHYIKSSNILPQTNSPSEPSS